ncbi:RNA methyltransferase [Sandaracinobacteroides saxicola]|uniref:RNA methyltransferase n=1 Tax=Sandaracinobacteroides saxicola TaxID=2759707 RepID=A0A7G5IFU1_9SPHN|nr:TrmH family RNA methyltransferase [Sandaracinobacteroides saxicola]QMW22233.1 RNA methyltransferase [Sandaracinobacteroides saxicola]
MTPDPAPAIILVRPQLGMNIGMVARAMANFGLDDLRLVNPRDGWPNPDAGPAAAGADGVLDSVRVYDSVDAALHDCRLSFATTMILKGLPKPVATPRHAVASIRAARVKAGILFGPEAAGMSKDDMAAVQTLITIPASADFASLNLAQAVLTLAYEWGTAAGDAPALRDVPDPPAPHAELAELVAQLVEALERAGYFHIADRRPTSERAIAAMLAKAGWSSQQVRTMRGIVRALSEARAARQRTT